MSRPARPDLPLSIIDLVETLDEFQGAGTGMRVALKLMRAFGGRDVKFPPNPKPEHSVVQALGMDDATALCEHLAGQQIYVPHGRGPRSQRQAVKTLEAEGRDRTAIAAALGISTRHVRRLANRTQPQPMPLFPDEN